MPKLKGVSHPRRYAGGTNLRGGVHLERRTPYLPVLLELHLSQKFSSRFFMYVLLYNCIAAVLQYIRK